MELITNIVFWAIFVCGFALGVAVAVLAQMWIDNWKLARELFKRE